jgi:predicted permease
MYALVVFGLAFFRYLDVLLATGQYATVTLLASIFPFPLALLPPLASSTPDPTPFTFGFDPAVIAVAAFLYLLVVAGLAVSLLRAPRRLLATVSEAHPSARPGSMRVRTGSIAAAVLVKDLRIASRTPTFAFLLLLPLLDAVAVGLYTYLTNPPSANAFALGSATVASAALLVTFFGPAFFAIEVMGYSYSRALPVPRTQLLTGKVALILLVYLVAAGIVLAFTLARVFDPAVFLVFVAAMVPAVLAAALFELSVLSRVARKSGLPIVNFYSGAWWAAVVAVPGILIVLAPLVAFYAIGAGAATLALTAMTGVALTELGVVGYFALGVPGRGSA